MTELKISSIQTIPSECKVIYIVDDNFEEWFDILQKSHSFEYYDDHNRGDKCILNFLLEDESESIHYLDVRADVNFIMLEPQYHLFLGLRENGVIVKEKYVKLNSKYFRRIF